MCLCLSDSLATQKISGESQNTGELPASDRNPAEDACCILIRLWGKAGWGVCEVAKPVGFQTNLSKNCGLGKISCSLLVLTQLHVLLAET